MNDTPENHKEGSKEDGINDNNNNNKNNNNSSPTPPQKTFLIKEVNDKMPNELFLEFNKLFEEYVPTISKAIADATLKIIKENQEIRRRSRNAKQNPKELQQPLLKNTNDVTQEAIKLLIENQNQILSKLKEPPQTYSQPSVLSHQQNQALAPFQSYPPYVDPRYIYQHNGGFFERMVKYLCCCGICRDLCRGGTWLILALGLVASIFFGGVRLYFWLFHDINKTPTLRV